MSLVLDCLWDYVKAPEGTMPEDYDPTTVEGVQALMCLCVILQVGDWRYLHSESRVSAQASLDLSRFLRDAVFWIWILLYEAPGSRNENLPQGYLLDAP